MAAMANKSVSDASRTAAAGSAATPGSVATAGGEADTETARAALLIQRRLRAATPPSGAAGSGD